MVTRRPRAVVLVGNPVAPYSRALRIARTLEGIGYAVEIAAVAAAGLPEREVGAGYEIRRYPRSGLWARLRASSRADDGAARSEGSAPRLLARTVRRVVRIGAALRRWLLWPHTVRGWWATLARDLPSADLYHACGSLTIAAALAARQRAPIGPAGRPAVVIYDAIDDVFESNNVLDMPGPVRAWHARRERRWARAADALITVNEPLADRLAARWGRRPVPIPNYPDLGAASDPEVDGPPSGPRPPDGTRPPGSGHLDRRAAGVRLRDEADLPASTRIVLFQGRLGPRLGLDEAAEAVLLVPDAALVLLGFGRGFEREQSRDRDPRFAGRHVTLPARHPDELLAWTAGADVALIPLPPVSVNQRLSSPNKFWEALAAGTPVVVPASLTYMAGIVRDGDLGVVATSERPADLARAMVTALDRSAENPHWPARIRELAAEQYAWPTAAETYRGIVRVATGIG